MNIFDKMNRKDKRAFDKLPKEKRMEFFQASITQKAMETTKDEIIKSFYRGYIEANRILAENYVSRLLEDDIEQDEVQKLLSGLFGDIMTIAKKYPREKANEEKEDK